ncbi:MAG: acetyl-CoA carboxylase, carboxyltransferase subunit beta [Bacteriovoracaceae bacterium]
MVWFQNVKNPKLKSSKKSEQSQSPNGLWKKCPQCGEILQDSKLEANLHVCASCQYHFRISATERIQLLVDENSFERFGEKLKSSDPLEFKDKISYKDRLEKLPQELGTNESFVAGRARVNQMPIILGVMDFSFMGGSMGVVTGELVARCMDLGAEEKKPVIIITASGGARMQEGILSLFQMAKASSSRQKLKESGAPYIVILTDPTTGGCAASFAMQGDISLAEPGALIGFAGPRVIEQTIRQSLPEGFQRSEFLLEHGFIDRIVQRKNLKEELSFFLKMFQA